MRFYYHSGDNVCAEERWVIRYILENENFSDWEEVYDNLRSRREFCDWFECEVSNTIEKSMENFGGVW